MEQIHVHDFLTKRCARAQHLLAPPEQCNDVVFRDARPELRVQDGTAVANTLDGQVTVTFALKVADGSPDGAWAVRAVRSDHELLDTDIDARLLLLFAAGQFPFL